MPPLTDQERKAWGDCILDDMGLLYAVVVSENSTSSDMVLALDNAGKLLDAIKDRIK